VVATVTSASLSDGVVHAWPKVAMLAAAWKMLSCGQGGGLLGAEGPFSGAGSPGPFGLPERKADPWPQRLPYTSHPVPWVYF